MKIKKLVSSPLKRRSLKPHQVMALDYALNLPINKNPAWFMEMRLGKTLVSIRYAQEKKFILALTLCPITTISSWQNELKLERIKTRVIKLSEWDSEESGFNQLESISQEVTAQQESSDPQIIWVVSNYELVRSLKDSNQTLRGRRLYRKFKNMDWDFIVLDESAKIKNPKSKTTKAVIETFSNIPNKALLSGLPSPENVLELFPQFKFLNGTFLGHSNYYIFRNQFFSINEWNYQLDPLPGTMDKIKEELDKVAFYITRKESDVAGSKKYITTRAPINKLQEQVMEKLYEYESLEVFPEEGELDESNGTRATTGSFIDTDDLVDPLLLDKVILNNTLQKYTKLRIVAGGFLPDKRTVISKEKFQKLLELVNRNRPGKGIVIWFAFLHELEYFRQFLLKESPYSHRCLTGAANYAYRKEMVDDFSNGSVDLLLATEQVGAFGMNLARADTMIYFSNALSNQLRQQSEDRIIHINKKHSVKIIDLVSGGTIDEYISKMMINKKFSSKLLIREVERMRINRS